MADNFNTNQRQRDGKGRVDRERVGKGGGGGIGHLSIGKEGIRRRELEGGRGRHRVTRGRVMWLELQPIPSWILSGFT